MTSALKRLLGFWVCLHLAVGIATADDRLVGRWDFQGDGGDRSVSQLSTRNHSVQLDVAGPGGIAGSAGMFDGWGAWLEVADQPPLKFGKGDFSVLVWVHVDENLDDLPGDIVSKYDPATRTGWQLSIDSRPGVTSSQANWRNLHFGIDQAKSEPQWSDHGRLGNAVLIYGMTVFNDQLFVGTCEAGKDERGRVFRYDGNQWSDCGAPDDCNSVSTLAVFNNQLYVGTSKYRLRGSSLEESGNEGLGGKVFRYKSDGDWEFCGQLPEVEAINGLAVYGGKLYASSMYAPAGFFRYEGGTKWTSCGTPDGRRVEALGVYNGRLYATGYDEGAVYRYDGSAWEHLGVLPEATQTYGFAVHHGRLYVSEWPHARVYRFGGPGDWVFAGRAGDEKETMPLLVYNGKMYVGTLPLAEVYRYDGDTQWTKVARLDHTPEVRYRRVWSMAVYRGRLFAGTLPSGRVHSIEIGKNVTYDRALAPGWRHIAAVKKHDRLLLYVDGKLAGASTPFANQDYDLDNDAPLKIGFGANDHFNGRMSDLRLYRRAVDADEIARIAGSSNE